MSKLLYLGTSLEFFSSDKAVIHYPVIRLIPKSIKEERVLFCLNKLFFFSHVLFTSKNTVEILWDLCHQLAIDPSSSLQGKCISIGPSTSAVLRSKGVEPLLEALESTQEGIIASLEGKRLKDVFYPRSSLARPLLSKYLIEKNITHELLDLYDTFYQEPTPKPSLEELGEIVFTSPSTVDGFFKIFEKIPEGIKVSFQGPVTERYFYETLDRLRDVFLAVRN